MAAPSDNLLTPIPFVNLGDVVAERDQHLKEYYIPSHHYEFAKGLDDPRLYFIGKKGLGKSALLQMIRLTEPHDHVIDLGNQDIGIDLLPMGEALSGVNESAQQLLFRSLWKAALMVSICRAHGKKWGHFGRTEPQKAIDDVQSKLVGLSGAVSLPNVVTTVFGSLKTSFETKGVKVTIDLRKPEFTEQLARSEMLRKINLAADNLQDLIKGHKAYVLLDDLDQSWRNDPLQNRYLAALFDTVERFSRFPMLKFAVALRLDIFKNLPLENPDKLVQHVHRLTWSPGILRRVVVRRLTRALGEPEARIMRRFQLRKAGHPVDNILQNCFQHPRDAIWTFQRLLNRAAEQEQPQIDQDVLDQVARALPSDRIRWVSSEWGHVHAWLADVLRRFRGGVNLYGRDALRSQLSPLPSGAPDIQLVLHGLLETGTVGLKFQRDGKPAFFTDKDPPPPPYEKSCWFELHPGVRRALQSGRW